MNNNQNLLFKYAGLGMQLLIGLGIAVFAGMKLDAFFKWKTPVAVWVFPLLFITAGIIKVIVDTGKNNKKK
jgi:hypothetical protein